jgi:site-specific DNA-methyltransferase (adenine-specific)
LRKSGHVLFSSKTVHWPTPTAVFNELNKEFIFDFDPCPLGESEKDGSSPLFTPWDGKRVFCNPPYNQGITPFLLRAKDAEFAVFLLPARTDTKWFHELVLPYAEEIRFIKGRLRFGDAKNSAPFPSMIVIFKKGAAN